MEEEASELGMQRYVRLGQFAREERLGTKQFELGCFPSSSSSFLHPSHLPPPSSFPSSSSSSFSPSYIIS